MCDGYETEGCIYLCICVCVCLSLWALCASSTLGGQKRALEPLDLELSNMGLNLGPLNEKFS